MKFHEILTSAGYQDAQQLHTTLPNGRHGMLFTEALRAFFENQLYSFLVPVVGLTFRKF